MHPGGPFWKNKDDGAWSIPKGEYDAHEDPLTVARREFEEETGHTVDGEFIALTSIRQASGKIVSAWAVEGDIDASLIRSNTFEIEWPPGSGRIESFPEVDEARLFSPSEALTKILPSQAGFVTELQALLR